jgi:hypothetical protein
MKKAPQGETRGFCGTKTHLAWSSPNEVRTILKRGALVQKEREILFSVPLLLNNLL